MTQATKAQEFKALVLDETEGKVSHSFKTLSNDHLPEGDVTVAVEYSSLNYKDGMIINGIGKLVRNYPHVPGVDFAGTVESSDSPNFKIGDKVVCTGWRVGEAHWGGYATRARVKSDWLVKLPGGLDGKRAMAIGTAGLTAALAVMALQEHGASPKNEGEILITGAAGGVGSVAVALLGSLGFKVAAGTGRAETHEYLKNLGATQIVTREELEQAPRGPLASERWAGAVDNVGGPILANLLASLKYGSSCAAVGLVASPKLETTVIPFLLRGVNLLGIDSVHCPNVRRLAGWELLAKSLPMEKLDAITTIKSMADLPELAGQILKGQVRGRVVIEVNA